MKNQTPFLLTASFETLIQSTLVLIFVLVVGYHLQLRAEGDKALKENTIRYVLPDSSEITTNPKPFSF